VSPQLVVSIFGAYAICAAFLWAFRERAWLQVQLEDIHLKQWMLKTRIKLWLWWKFGNTEVLMTKAAQDEFDRLHPDNPSH
jgi:hypothetical protein